MKWATQEEIDHVMLIHHSRELCRTGIKWEEGCRSEQEDDRWIAEQTQEGVVDL
jgi:hypothetical protein